MYDVKFRQKAAASNSITWSENVCCRPFTYEEDIVFFFSNQDPHPRQVHLEGTSIVLALTSRRVGSVLGPPAPMQTSATSQVVEQVVLGA